ncbi:MAG: hypothetical protein JNN07_29210 [Verrucomicrobiales bacterium]|nr:hypothetical protein [Verrucomicrobiales bacterium]
MADLQKSGAYAATIKLRADAGVMAELSFLSEKNQWATECTLPKAAGLMGPKWKMSNVQ